MNKANEEVIREETVKLHLFQFIKGEGRLKEVKQKGMKGLWEGRQRQATKTPGNQEGLEKAGDSMGTKGYLGEGRRLLRNNNKKPWGVSRALMGISNCGVAGTAPGAGKDGENGQAAKDTGNKGRDRVGREGLGNAGGPAIRARGVGTPGGAQGQRTEGGPGKH